MKIGFVSLGCPKNRLDTEVMLAHLNAAGYEITPEETEADVIVVNTCAFIESAKKESIDAILDVAYLKEHGNLKGLIVTGCLAERYREEVAEQFPEVDAVLGVGSVHSIVKAVQSIERKEKFQEYFDRDLVALGGDRIVTTGGGMAYLKIAEGCDNHCTYCAIPSIRGKFRSRPIDDLIEEAKELVSLGAKEIVLIAQDTTKYGIDLYGEYKLAELLSRLSIETDVKWLRILYCYPDKITDELIAELRDNDKVVKYIDLPIQHIADRVLKRMGRIGDGKLIRSVIAKLRENVPGIVVRSTAIVGFPGETDEEFSELCAFLHEAKFERFGAFPYSREEGTPAYRLKEQIDEQTKQDRYDILMREQLEVTEAYLKGRIGKTLEVLVEGYDVVAETYYGRSRDDAPDIDGKVYFTSKEKIGEGSLVSVKITEAMDYDLIGDLQK